MSTSWPPSSTTAPMSRCKDPKKPRKVKPVWTSDGLVLFWQSPKAKHWGDQVNKYVVYRFAKNEKINLDDPNHIVAITNNTFLNLPYQDGKQKYTYVVTSLDRVGNESEGAKKKLKL